MDLFNLIDTKEKRSNLRKTQTDAERLLWNKLRNKQMHGFKIFRQYGIDRYIVDFYCPLAKLAIEVDGGQHFDDKHKAYDMERDNFLKSVGIRTIRVTNVDVMRNIEGVIKAIEGELPPAPSLLKRGSRGMALVIVLWVAVILSSITAAGAYIVRLEMRRVDYSLKDMQLLGAVIEGVEKVKYELISDNNSYDSLKERWKCVFNDGIKTGDCDVAVSVEDVYPDGIINVNTAPAEVLMTLPSMDYLNAQFIIARRNGKDLIQGTQDDLPYDEITKVKEAVSSDIYKKIEKYITVKSSNFKVILKAVSGKHRKDVESLLSRDGNFVRIKYWKEL